ncbi:uncharacterized protein K460DRAFT_285676 [Cucurbitaria berberidis CBS 394.84]|uniref:NADH dehydrogenase [ubiquinone] 1 alpha subcomplex subunit 1 n=1 Tax=Cucurbitaria berberidis CBS 394.84 TaxID=1168544 RepID=A0A9P4GGV8_9PLEO|nr:uncharacterized protein K460DRAFT_285676 [Cucurbitaria berberidis CBS 394.84]KAF1845387.1 hypothetical protein K460DRAFT_285676 [Cucurbitaria berberidis CBS 394.84]
MGIPFEAFLPYAIMTGFFAFSAISVGKLREMQNGGKRARRGIDQWDRVMMERDRRLTGFARGQTDKPIAPAGFELNNPWRVWIAIHPETTGLTSDSASSDSYKPGASDRRTLDSITNDTHPNRECQTSLVQSGKLLDL